MPKNRFFAFEGCFGWFQGYISCWGETRSSRWFEPQTSHLGLPSLCRACLVSSRRGPDLCGWPATVISTSSAKRRRAAPTELSPPPRMCWKLLGSQCASLFMLDVCSFSSVRSILVGSLAVRRTSSKETSTRLPKIGIWLRKDRCPSATLEMWKMTSVCFSMASSSSLRFV